MNAVATGPLLAIAAAASPPPSAASPPPSAVTPSHLVHLLNQCTTVPHLKQIHAQFFRTGPSLYASFAWNTLIKAYAWTPDEKQKSLFIFCQMLDQENLVPDKYTFPFVLKACAYIFALSEGKQVHAQIIKRGLWSDLYVSNSLIHFYSSCGGLEFAKKVFDKMPDRNVVSWNAMINGLVELGEFEDALRMFSEMQTWFDPDGYTVQSLIDACAGLGVLSLGIWAHCFVLRKCMYKEGDNLEVLVNNSLIEMYSKCGALDFAVQVFEGMDRYKCDVNSWNSMILGFAMHGKVEKALDCFRKMVEVRIFPNSITFLGVMSACNHRGLVEEGRQCFKKMVDEFNIEPVLEHYGCLVDLLARAGFIDEALDIVSSMKMKPDLVIWRSLVDACCKQNAGMELAEELGKKMMNEGSRSSGAYVLLSKVYASANRWDEVGLIRKLMSDNGVQKEPGCSVIDVRGVAHEFFAGDSSHPQAEEIYQHLRIIDEKLRSAGFVAEEFSGSRLHSERLAVAFGLLNREPGVPVRVFKNLRICKDCHGVMKLISEVFDVEVIIRDRLRFHHFRDGLCSCMDYW